MVGSAGVRGGRGASTAGVAVSMPASIEGVPIGARGGTDGAAASGGGGGAEAEADALSAECTESAVIVGSSSVPPGANWRGAGATRAASTSVLGANGGFRVM